MPRLSRPGRTVVAGVGAVALALLAAACGSSSVASPGTSSTSSPASTTTTSTSRPGGGGATLWLCRPGLADNPCTSDLTTSVVHTDGSITVEHDAPAADPAVDCFYVYPTVSLQNGVNATMTVGPEERAVAIAQAARFSQVCRVYAPIYRQITVHGLFSGKLTGNAVTMPYTDVLAAWRDYLAYDNHGRGVILIGHSQGSFVLEQLIKQEIDPSPAARRLLVSAILLGGNVVVPVGGQVGGTFARVPGAGAPRRPVASWPTRASTTRPPPTACSVGRPRPVTTCCASTPLHRAVASPRSTVLPDAHHARGYVLRLAQGDHAMDLLPRRVHRAVR